MTKQFALYAFVGLLAFSLTACDALEVDPETQVAAEDALNSPSGFESVLISAYDHLQEQTHYGQQFMLYPEALADNIRNTEQNSNRYVYPVFNQIGSHLTRWGPSYAAINEVNNVLGAVDNMADQESQAWIDRVKGEALFLRALNHFDLVRTKAYEPGMYVDGWEQGIILRTEATERPEDVDYRARATVEEVYQQIEADLKEAITLLKDAGNSKYRANYAAANALLARVYLYWQQWEQAEIYATEAINATTASLAEGEARYVQAFTDRTNPESIFELQFESTNDGDVTGFNESLNSLTNIDAGGWGDLVPTDDLLEAYEEGDARLALYFPAKKGQESVYYINKWNSANGPYTHNVPVIRLAEVYLIRAEARAEQNEIADAQADLNTIRHRVGLGDTPADSRAELIEAVLQERRVEFAFEGQRFFDLKRRGLDIPKPQSIGVLPYDDFRVLAPIPQREVDTNTKLDQNPHY